MPRKKIDPTIRPLLKACDTFGRACKIMERLPFEHQPDDRTGLRSTLPGVWPTVGELRALRTEMEKLGWTTDTFR